MLDPALATLSTEAKLTLIDELWDSIVISGDEPPVTDEERSEIQARLDELDKGPYETTDWEVLREELKRRSK